MNIMFVCTGNTCRSAMAEALARKEINKRNLNINVKSSGTYAMEGEHASYNAIAIMKEYDADIVTHTATPISNVDIAKFDLILCATQNHKCQVIMKYPEVEEKVYTMKEYAKLDNNGKDMDIADPWGYELNTYRLCAAEISLCVDKIIERIANEKGE